MIYRRQGLVENDSDVPVDELLGRRLSAPLVLNLRTLQQTGRLQAPHRIRSSQRPQATQRPFRLLRISPNHPPQPTPKVLPHLQVGANFVLLIQLDCRPLFVR